MDEGRTPERERQLLARARALLTSVLPVDLALRHEQSLAASLDPAFAQENWGFLAQQGVASLWKGFIVLADVQPPLSHDIASLAQPAGCGFQRISWPFKTLPSRRAPRDLRTMAG